MTKAELLFIAKDVALMDKLNCISGLLEMNKPEDQMLIDAFVNDIYSALKENPPVTYKKNNKCHLLTQIAIIDPELANQLKDKRISEIRYAYNKLTNNNN